MVCYKHFQSQKPAQPVKSDIQESYPGADPEVVSRIREVADRTYSQGMLSRFAILYGSLSIGTRASVIPK